MSFWIRAPARRNVALLQRSNSHNNNRRSAVGIMNKAQHTILSRHRLFSSSSAAATAGEDIQSNKNNNTDPYIKGSETHFGFENVNVEEKEHKVRKVFENVADSYDVMNDFMSAGLHRYWKDYLVDLTAVSSMASSIRRQQTQQQEQEQELRILDVAGGTGDISFRMVDAAGCFERSKSSGFDPISVTVCDINTEMLRVGEKRARDKYGSSLIDSTQALKFIEGNAQDLNDKFQDNTFDLYTIAFGLRNVTDVDRALKEALRVLKPGGRFMCLEFSIVPDPILRSIYDSYSFNVIPELGNLIANDRDSYQYLVESIRKFPNQDELVTRIANAGFQAPKYTNLTGGIVAIHEGWKPVC